MKIDLITGILGAGKTTFLEKYARYLVKERSLRICVIACDLGAISVDRTILATNLGDICDVEMVTAGDLDCFLPRLQAKLVQVYMLGYDRILMEPSGSFDVDALYNLLRNDPLDRWYEVGNIIAVLDYQELAAGTPLPKYMEYLLTSQCANAGLLLFSKVTDGKVSDITVETRDSFVDSILEHLCQNATEFHCSRNFMDARFLLKPWNKLNVQDWEMIFCCGHVKADLMKISESESGFSTLFYYHLTKTAPEMKVLLRGLFQDSDQYGNVYRIKGFFQDAASGKYYELNATSAEMQNKDFLRESVVKQEVLLVIGESLHSDNIGIALGETRRVTEYDV